MNEEQITSRNDRADGLKVFRIDDHQYFVESSKGKICYKVGVNNGNKACTCADYVSNISKDSGFVCKHILAVVNGNGNIAHIMKPKPVLDERFITRIKGKEFVIYSGVLDMAHQIGIHSVEIKPVQYPNSENGMEAICRAKVITNSGEEYIEYGDANPKNVSSMVREHVLRVAATRAKARAFRDMTNVGITCLDELGDVSESQSDEKPKGKTYTKSKADAKAKAEDKPKVEVKAKGEDKPKPEAKAEDKPKAETKGKADQQDDKKTETKAEVKTKPDEKTESEDKPKMSAAQANAIRNIAQRRGISEEELQAVVMKNFNTEFENLSPQDAAALIKNLQQSS